MFFLSFLEDTYLLTLSISFPITAGLFCLSFFANGEQEESLPCSYNVLLEILPITWFNLEIECLSFLYLMNPIAKSEPISLFHIVAFVCKVFSFVVQFVVLFWPFLSWFNLLRLENLFTKH
ncbi:hypothetical protein M6B38_173760 [Iris pallida]|uniref:Uncharacterized protein n=1 Tax=Iris pallida TaxID=29817 RepID=A0AAX6ERG3_IRIPA|nr:hypothetical protein M6B38_173760 [Iris pallida]